MLSNVFALDPQRAISPNVDLVDTWWFYGLCGLALVLAMGIIWRERMAAAVRRETALQLEVTKRTAELARLTELTELINEAVTVEDVLNHLYENLQSIIPYDRIGLALLDEDRVVLRAVWSRGKTDPVGIGRGYEAPLAGSSLEATLRSGRPRIIPDLEKYLEEHPRSESTRRILSEGIRSNLTCPLRALGRPVGFLFFSSFQANTYNGAHTEFLEQIAGHLSLIVGKSKLYEDLLATKERLENANRELERLAAVDGLTGLANRRAFDEHLDAEWRRALRSDEPLSLLMIDVDFFKAFNDRYGHGAGDDCLRSISNALAEEIRRAGDLVARYGGEEFGVVLPRCDRDRGIEMAEKLRSTVEGLAIPHDASMARPVVTISVGVGTVVPGQNDRPERLLELADRGLYEAKRTGRNRVVFGDEVAAGSVDRQSSLDERPEHT